MLSVEMRNKATEIGEAQAKAVFDMMLDPINRGPNFTWENLPAMAANLARVSAFIIFSDEEWASFGEELEAWACSEAYWCAEALVSA